MSKSSPEDRDQTQRSLGFMGLSALAHIGLLITVLLAPSFRATVGATVGATDGSNAGVELNDDSTPAASASAVNSGAASSPNASGAPMEVMLADANDASAVELPASATIAAATAATAEPVAKPVEKKPIETKTAGAKSAHAKAAAPKVARFEKAAAVKSQNIVETPGEIAPNGDIETQAPETQSADSETAPTETPETQSADTQSASAQSVAANDAEVQPTVQSISKPVDQSSDDDGSSDDNTPEDEEETAVVKNQSPAVPIKIALPESESLTDKQAQALQAPKIPSSAKPITAVPSRARERAASPATQPSGATGAVLVGRPGNQAAAINNGNASGAPNASRGGGTGYSVPIGVPVRDARSLIAMPGNAKPVYPLADKVAGRQGTAVLVGKVTAAGAVESVTLEKSSGSKLMDESAASAFKSWHYKPGQEGYVRLPVQFQLIGDAQEIPSQLRRQ